MNPDFFQAGRPGLSPETLPLKNDHPVSVQSIGAQTERSKILDLPGKNLYQLRLFCVYKANAWHKTAKRRLLNQTPKHQSDMKFRYETKNQKYCP